MKPWSWWVLVCSIASVPSARADSGFQDNWSPNRYELVCEHDSCLEAGVKHKLDMNLRGIVSFYRNQKWRAPKRFGPLVKQHGKPAVRIGEAANDRIAWVSEACPGDARGMGVGRGIRSWLNRPHLLYYFMAHEMFHAIQSSYPAIHAHRCKPPGWVKESTADAVGLDAMRAKFPQLRAGTEREARKFSGLRHYDVPLQTYAKGLDDKVMVSGAHIYYLTSSFWRHLAEAYHGGSYRYLQQFLRVRPDGGDWLGWLHRRLLVDPKIRAGLGPVYALFVADYATWGDSGGHGEHFGRERWLNEAFRGCQRVTLSPKAPEQRVKMRLRRTAARCVKVQVTGVRPDQRIAVMAGALREAGAVKLVDQVHLSMAASTDRTKFSCGRAIRSTDVKKRIGGMARCVMLPSTGTATIGKQKLAARIFDVIPQRIRRGGSFENLYLVSRVASSPTDQPAADDGGKVLEIDMLFVLNTEDLRIAGARPSGNKRATSSVNLDPHNVTREAVPKHDPSGNLKRPKLNLMSVRKPAFSLSNIIPMGRAGGQGKSSGGLTGIYRITLSRLTVESDGLWEVQKPPQGDSVAAVAAMMGDTFSFMPLEGSGKELKPRPLAVGDTGRFPAMLGGNYGTRGLGSPEPGTIVVEEFTPWVLRVRVKGTFCNVMKMSKETPCPDPLPVEGTMVKAFSGLRIPGSTFVIEDTPGDKLYENITDHWVNLALGREGDSSNGSKGTGGSGGGGTATVGKSTCKCSCDDLENYQKEVARLKEKYRPEEREPDEKQSRELMAEMRGLTECLQPCMSFYAACQKKKKRRRGAGRERRTSPGHRARPAPQPSEPSPRSKQRNQHERDLPVDQLE